MNKKKSSKTCKSGKGPVTVHGDPPAKDVTSHRDCQPATPPQAATVTCAPATGRRGEPGKGPAKARQTTDAKCVVTMVRTVQQRQCRVMELEECLVECHRVVQEWYHLSYCCIGARDIAPGSSRFRTCDPFLYQSLNLVHLVWCIWCGIFTPHEPPQAASFGEGFGLVHFKWCGYFDPHETHKQLPCLTLMGLPSGLERTRGVVEHFRGRLGAPVQEEQPQHTPADGGPHGGRPLTSKPRRRRVSHLSQAGCKQWTGLGICAA
jgi:hypothetical protein